jgi:hypothetical protein
MIGKFIKWTVNGITPAQLDGTLYVLIAVFGVTQSVFSADDAYKYVNPYLIFWIKSVTAIIGAGVGALKMFRSTTYAEYMKSEADKAAKAESEKTP